MDRTTFYTEVTVDEVKELDFLRNALSEFSMEYDPTFYRVKHEDLMRPYKISYRVYGTVDFWWIICLVNKIDSPLSDFEVGQVLEIPNQLDIYNFQRKFRVRRNR